MGRLARMTERPTELQSTAEAEGPDLEEEIARRDEEILRLRDLLIGRDAELGAARGQLAVVEEHSQRLSSLLRGLRANIPGALRLGGNVLRRLQGRRD